MARWTPVPIAGGAYSDDTRPWAHQDCVNYIPTPAERPGARSDMKLTSAPGFTTFCATMQEAPVRALHNVEGLLLAVTGDTLYRIGVDGVATSIGTIPGVRRCSIAHNQITGGHEVLVANGQGGYVYNTADGTFGQVTDDGFPGMKVADFVDGYIAGIEPAGRYWLHSNLRAATDYNTLDRYDSESSPDKMVSLIVSHREVMVLNQRSSAFYRNVGGSTGTFQNSNGTELEVGCASTHAVARLDNTVFWLGNDGIVYRLAGHAPQRVSTGPIEQAISRCNTANAFAFTFEDHGHKIFYLTFPDGATWGYDVWTNEWHRRQSKDLPRWRLSDLVQWNGAWIGGDFSNGLLYQLDWAVQTEAGEEMEKRRITPVLHDNQNRITLNAVELVVDTGVAAAPRPIAPLSVSGDLQGGERGDSYSGRVYSAAGGVDPYVSFTVSAGTFPPGLTLNSDGSVTGTTTEGGSFSWTVQVTDSVGNTATTTDSADIWATDWWMTGAESGTPRSSLWVSEDVSDWSDAYVTTRSPWVDPSGGTGGGGYYQTTESSAFLVGSTGAGEYTTDLNAIDGVLTSNVATGTGSGVRVRAVDGYVFVFTTTGGETFSVSSDGGATWSTKTAPDSLKINDIGRLDSGRWVAFMQSGSTQRFYYSDDEGVPETWTQAAGVANTSNPSAIIVTFGNVAMRFGTAGRIFWTDGGGSWAEVASGVVSGNGGCGAAYGDVAVIGSTNSSVLWHTADAGLTWTSVPFRNTRRIDCHAGRWVACCSGLTGGIFYSDDGLDWSAASLPPAVEPSFYDTLYVAPIRYLP